MAIVVDVPAADIVTTDTPRVRWNALTRIAFRFSLLYFGFYVTTTQMLGGMIVIPNWEMPELERLPPLRNLISWTAVHVFGVTQPLVIGGSGSGDKTFDWVAAFCLLAISIVATAAWSILDRRCDNYSAAHKWFRLFLRFATGSTMLSYGMVKAIPLQMPAPSLTRLLEPFGNFSPMGVLWYSIGAARGYERFAGSAELAAAVLLFIPRTAMLGALVLLAPDTRRLLNVLVLNRPAPPSSEPPLAQGVRARRGLLGAQLVFGVYLFVIFFMSSQQGWTRYGGGAPKPPLYGIWNVERMSIDGVERAPLVTDYDRWRRVVFQSASTMMFQRMDETFTGYSAKTDMDRKTIALTKTADRSWKSELTFDRPEAERMTIDGTMDGHRIRMQLRLVDHTTMLLLSRGFNWIQEYPFNR